ncbi:hypothetical protein BX070DRAFT_100462 [Coemansia spiralis]|nr:hypothetical protein BX070DRAFT_100462 [Coemansia spiralis]
MQSRCGALAACCTCLGSSQLTGQHHALAKSLGVQYMRDMYSDETRLLQRILKPLLYCWHFCFDSKCVSPSLSFVCLHMCLVDTQKQLVSSLARFCTSLLPLLHEWISVQYVYIRARCFLSCNLPSVFCCIFYFVWQNVGGVRLPISSIYPKKEKYILQVAKANPTQTVNLQCLRCRCCPAAMYGGQNRGSSGNREKETRG